MRMSLARKRKEPEHQALSKINTTQTVFLLPFLNIGELFVFKKEREKLKEFCFIISKLVNELCYMLQSGDLDTFSSRRKKKKKKEKKEKEEKDW